MKVCHTFIYFFFLTALQDGNIDLINAEILVRTGTEGGNITVECTFTFSGSRKLFCKKECEGKDILVETTGDRAQSGRYSIEYKKDSYFSSPLLYVSITNLTKSDSGRYRCSLDRLWPLGSYEDIDITVEDAPITSKPNRTLRPFSTSVPSASTLTITQSLSSSSGSSAHSSASPGATEQSQQQQTKPAAGSGVLLYVRLILVIMIIVLSGAVLIFCRRRASKPKERLEETEYSVTEANPVYEEIREEDRRSRSPPVDISTVYTCAKDSKPNGVETTDDYSFVTAASPQNKTEDASRKLTYSEVDFSNGPAALLISVPRGDTDNVVHSVPQVEGSSDGSHTEDASAPLYSTVTLHQQ